MENSVITLTDEVRDELRNLGRYTIKDTDNSCMDPACCGGPFPSFRPVSDNAGEFVQYEVLEAILAPKYASVLASFTRYEPEEEPIVDEEGELVRWADLQPLIGD